MKAILVAIFCLLQFSSSAQVKYSKKEMAGWLPQKTFSKKWFREEYKSYHPDEAILKKLQLHLADKKIVVLLGTWCSDSRREFPRLMKVLDEMHRSERLLSIYAVTKDKLQPAEIIAKYMTHVPTVIVLNTDGTERGRITETVKTSIESDLLSF